MPVYDRLVAERKKNRNIVGPIKVEFGIWRARVNGEIGELVAEPYKIEKTKSARLRLLGHVKRMGKDRADRKAYLRRPMGCTPVCRPRYHWKDGVAEDLKELNVPQWSDLEKVRKMAYFGIGGQDPLRIAKLAKYS